MFAFLMALFCLFTLTVLFVFAIICCYYCFCCCCLVFVIVFALFIVWCAAPTSVVFKCALQINWIGSIFCHLVASAQHLH